MQNANASAARPVAVARPGARLLNPQDHTLIMIDFQSQTSPRPWTACAPRSRWACRPCCPPRRSRSTRPT